MPDLGRISTKRHPAHQLNSTGQIYHLHNVCGDSLAGSCGTEHFYVSAEHERERERERGGQCFLPTWGRTHSLTPGGAKKQSFAFIIMVLCEMLSDNDAVCLERKSVNHSCLLQLSCCHWFPLLFLPSVCISFYIYMCIFLSVCLTFFLSIYIYISFFPLFRLLKSWITSVPRQLGSSCPVCTWIWRTFKMVSLCAPHSDTEQTQT